MSVKIAVFDAQSYDRTSFDGCLTSRPELKDKIQYTYLPFRLSPTTVSAAAQHHAVCCFVNDDLSAGVIQELGALGIKQILVRCAGFDRVDLAAAKASGIDVCRVPAYSPYAVAEFALALLMTLNRRTHMAYNRVRDNDFRIAGLVGSDVAGKTVAVIGTGKIGQCFIDIMIGFKCKILAYDLYVNKEYESKPEVTYVPLEEALRNADIVSLHAPLTPETKHLINAKTLAIMKKNAIIVNTSRGGLIDTDALVRALVNKQIRGAGLDVYEREAEYFFQDLSDKEISDCTLARLQNMRNVIITSHQAFLTEEALSAIAATTLLNIEEYMFEGKRGTALKNYVA